MIWLCTAVPVAGGPEHLVEVGVRLENAVWLGQQGGGTGYWRVCLGGASVNLQAELPEGGTTYPAKNSEWSFFKMQVGKRYAFSVANGSLYTGNIVYTFPECTAGYCLRFLDVDDQVVDTYSDPDDPEDPEDTYGPQVGGELTPTVILDGPLVEFVTSSCGCGVQVEGAQLTADGSSEAFAYVTGQVDLTWSFEGDDLGCGLEPVRNESSQIIGARITAGTKNGSVIVKGSKSGCTYKGVLTLACGASDDWGGGFGEAESGGGCAATGLCKGLGQGSIRNDNGIDFRLSLGLDQYGYTAGSLGLQASTPSAQLSQPSVLRVLAEGPTTEWRRDENGVIRQIRTAVGLVEVTAIDDYCYRLDSYTGDLGPEVNGWYTTTTNSVVQSTWMVRNPDTSGQTYHQLWISEIHGAATNTFKYSFDSTNNVWAVEDDTALRKLVAWQETAGSTRYEHREVRHGTTVQAKVRRKYEPVAGREVLKEILEGTDQTTRTTTYTYYPSSGYGNNNDQLKQIDYPDGRWEIFEYDSNHRVAQTFQAWQNQSPTATGSLCKVTAYTYNLSEASDDGTYAPHLWRRMTVSVLGHEVARSYRKIIEGETIEKRCPGPGASWTDTNNVVTTTQYYTSGEHRGRVQQITHPDQTMSFYSYTADGSGFATTVAIGEPNAQKTAVQQGTETTTLIGNAGELLSRIERPIIGGEVQALLLSSEEYTYLDEAKLSYQVERLGGLVEETQQGCCGVESQTDPDGATTTYAYDYWKRPVATCQVEWGLTYLSVLDAAGRLLERRRIGTNEPQQVLEQSRYDVLGRVIAHTNALGGVTTHSEGLTNSGLHRLTVNLDQGQRLEVYYRDGRLERVTNNAALPVRYAYGVEQDGANGPWREVSIEIRDDGAGNTNEWVKTFLDGMGQGYKTVYASASGTPYRLLGYNNLGQLTTERDPDGVTRLHGYNARGERYRSGIDMDGSGVLEPNGATGTDDRFSETFETVVAAEAGTNSLGKDLRRVQTWVYATNNSSVPMLVRTVDVSNDGLKRAEIRQRDSSTPVTNRTETVYGTNGIRTVTVTSPDNSSQVSVYSYGRLQSVTRKDSIGGQVSQTTYGYDAHGRQSTVTDARNGTTAFAYNNADQVVSVTAPLLGTGEAAQVTTSFYDQAGRMIGQQLPDGTTTTNLYTTTGLLQRTYGSRLYPVEYTYDAQGRMRTMTTWQNFAGNSGTATTRWNYDPYRGWLGSKDYPDAATGEVLAGSGPIYTNSPAGRLQTRDWKRGVRTTYSYNAAGDLASVAYSDGTPGTTYAYDRRGRRLTSVRDNITTTLSYTDTDQPLTESHSGGTLDGLSTVRGYDSALRLGSVQAMNVTNVLQASAYGYDTAGRLGTVTDGSASATYAYHANSTLISTLTLTNSGSAGLVTSRTYDKLNRLTSISSKAYGSSAPSLPVSFDYQYNPANQRTRATLQDGCFWGYQYDALGQVVSGKKYWSDGTPVAGQQFEYRFDDIGNRTTTKTGGNASGQDLRPASYTVTRLNQYTNRTVPAALDVLGLANPVATVTLNSGTNVYRRGEYFWKELGIDNSSAAQWTALTVNAAFGSTNQSSSGYVFLPKTPEVFIHDADGNLLSDGRWTNTWDGENRLVGMVSLTNAPAESKRWLQFTYDQQGRRILKTVCWWTNSAWRVVISNKFLYDGWSLVAELNATNNALIRSYVWGNDLSGSLQGAGGVGGLVAMTDTGSRYFPAYDGNGNVAGLTSASDGSLAAAYEYGPFAEPLRVTGPKAKSNPIRFSTKYTDDESGFLDYGYRYYSPGTGRWISRDPVGESQDRPLYVCCNNTHLGRFDLHGLKSCCTCIDVDIMVAPAPTLEELSLDGSFVGWSFGLKITYKVRVIGDPSACTCTIRERGTVQEYLPGSPSVPLPLSETRTAPCSGLPPDHPGLLLNPLPTGPGDWILDYDLRQTLICQGSGSYGPNPSKSFHIKKMFTGVLPLPPPM